ncbi:MAG TPA: CHAT domain-containing protein [Chthoniobacterales bacterium]|jgi:pimeloyl-ACP methyl ester carboxylesterase|nr:CHAT domain-containing protein [Chthoniobacterales bacterium]
MNERAFLAQLESANTDELTQILRRPTAEEERVLEIYFGRQRLQRLRSLALGTQQRAVPRGNVVVLHGIMGGEMTVYPEQESSQFIWLSFPRLAIGAVGWLRMAADLTSEFNVKPTGILKRWYSDMIMELSAERWNVRAFWFDWRLDLAKSAAALHQQINEWFGESAPVNLVAHSMGGLVSRTYILNHRERWDKGGRLIMLGTPNHGSFAIPQVITGAFGVVRKLAIVDVAHSRRQLCGILNTFPGSMQMLPSPLVMENMKPMYRAEQWQTWEVGQNLLDLGLASHKRLEKIVDPDRMAYIAGYNQVTQVDVQDWLRLDEAAGYRESLEGDGTVPHRLGFMDRDGQKLFPTYFVDCKHGKLPAHPEVIAGTKELLAGDDCSLPKTMPAKRAAAAAVGERAAADAALQLAEEETLRELSRRVRGRTRAAGGATEAPIAKDEIEASEVLVREFLSAETAAPQTENEPRSRPSEPQAAPRKPKMRLQKPPPITIAIAQGGIENEALTIRGSSIAVGHYIGVSPQNAELALDKAISQGIPSVPGQKKGDLLLTQLCRRGIFVGELGQNFFLPDPRDRSRVIVLAGMGPAGAFGEAELAVLSRELVWTLGRSGRKQLFTVLIGAGAGNLGTASAVRAWLRGIRRAFYDAVVSGDPTLRRITFVEHRQTNFVRLDHALAAAVPQFAVDPEEPLEIDYARPAAAIRKKAGQAAASEAAFLGQQHWERSLTEDDSRDPEPIRLTVELRRDVYQFAALTEEAAIPQRETQIDPVLVDEVNNQLPLAETPAQQLDRGHLLETLLLPGDLRSVITRRTLPVVLAVDATTARIHWEMLALEQAGTNVDFKPESFLGARAGLTRQLRTTFAQLPEPPMLTGRALRVLVVADPADDQPLPGAQEEGEAVAAIFEEFGRQKGRNVEVLKLLGPGQATRVTVLDQLINQRFDILHYAGHCFFNPKDPAGSGWIFSKNSILSAHELSRIDRIPRFIFSNACESGITPQRLDRRNAAMAPSFAESFFARGVANFVCTAWPVGDAAALAFARRVYRGALGLRGNGAPPEPLHQAMAEARQEIARTDLSGLQTWGAYQHYGDPNFRFIPQNESAARPDNAAKAAPVPAKRRRNAPKQSRRRQR